MFGCSCLCEWGLLSYVNFINLSILLLYPLSLTSYEGEMMDDLFINKKCDQQSMCCLTGYGLNTKSLRYVDQETAESHEWPS